MKLFAPLTAAALAAALATALTAPPALAQGPMEMAVKAREGMMMNLAFNLGILGAMAKGQMPYDAARAQTAADNLVKLASVDESAYWPKGSDSTKLKTRALPEIWQKPDAFAKHFEDLRMGTANMQGAAGKGADAIKAAMNSVGSACGGCHRAFRAPE